MNRPTIIWHSGPKPLDVLKDILEDFRITALHSNEFTVVSSGGSGHSVKVISRDLVLDREGLPINGTIDGLVLLDGKQIAAQIIGLHLSIRDLRPFFGPATSDGRACGLLVALAQTDFDEIRFP